MTKTNTNPTITVQQIMNRPAFGPHETMYVAHGPDGHEWMLKRMTESAAAADGLAYFLATRKLIDGRWVLR